MSWIGLQLRHSSTYWRSPHFLIGSSLKSFPNALGNKWGLFHKTWDSTVHVYCCLSYKGILPLKDKRYLKYWCRGLVKQAYFKSITVNHLLPLHIWDRIVYQQATRGWMGTTASFTSHKSWTILYFPVSFITGKIVMLQGDWQDFNTRYFKNL
jgi:hypothetical protein